MIRRKFFKTLFGAIGSVLAAPHIPIKAAADPMLGYEVLAYKGVEHFGKGIIYCPYIPLIKIREISYTEIKNEFKPKEII